jgi:hypothetical protein
MDHTRTHTLIKIQNSLRTLENVAHEWTARHKIMNFVQVTHEQ